MHAYNIGINPGVLPYLQAGDAEQPPSPEVGPEAPVL